MNSRFSLLTVMMLFCFVQLSELLEKPILFAQNTSVEQGSAVEADADSLLANQYFNKAKELSNEAQYDSSHFYLRKARLLYKNMQSWAKYVQTYNVAGENFRAKGDHKKANELLNMAMEIGKDKLNENHIAIGQIYHNLGSLNFSRGDYDKALNFFEKSAETKAAVIGENHPEVGLSYGNIGLILKIKGDYDKALQFYQKALKIFLNSLGENHVLIAVSNSNIGNIYKDKSEYGKALEYYNNALKIRRQISGDRHPHVADIYTNIANLHRLKSDYKKAFEYHRKSLSIRKEILGERHPEVAACYNNIGNVYSDKGDYDKALEFYHRTLSMQLEIFNGDPPGDIGTYNNIAIVHSLKADYDKAIEFYQKALDLRIRKLGPKNIYVADIYGNAGNVYHEKADYDKALEFFKKALSIRREILGEQNPEFARICSSIGATLDVIGKYDQALDFHRKALSIRSEILDMNHPDVAESYVNIGSVYRSQELYGEALQSYQKALPIFLKSYGIDHPFVATTYINIGDSYFGLEVPDSSLFYYDKSLTSFLNTFGESHPNVARAYLKLSELYFDKRDYLKSMNYVHRAMTALNPSLKDRPIYHNPSLENMRLDDALLSVLNTKAEIFERLYSAESHQIEDLQVSYSTYNLASEAIDKIRTGLSAEGSKLFLGQQASEAYAKAIMTALKLNNVTHELQHKEQAFTFAEKSKAAVLWEALSESKAKRFAGIPKELLKIERSLKIDLAHYETQIQKEKQKQDHGDSLKITDFEERFFKLNREYENLIAQFEKEYPKYYDLKYRTEPASVQDVQNNLNSESTLIEYVLADSSLYILVLSRTAFDVIQVRIDSTFKDSFFQFYGSLKKFDKKNFLRHCTDLYARLIQPIEPQLVGKKKLIIIPDDILYYIPFEALVASKVIASKSAVPNDESFTGLDYLIKKFDISYHYSATLWLQSQEKHSVKDHAYDFIGFAPVFREGNSKITFEESSFFSLQTLKEFWTKFTRDGENLGELEYSEHEVKDIRQLFEENQLDGKIYLHRQASEENFKFNINDNRILHVATHGFSDSELPKLSNLAFSPPQESTASEDGFLYASEIYNLDLNTDLVVLSSCESGVGKLVKGEGLMALTRGFLYAGTANIIFSLWKVSDKFTRDLMVEFYRQVVSGKSYSEALRRAKLQMIGNETTAFPALWGPFVLIGE